MPVRPAVGNGADGLDAPWVPVDEGELGAVGHGHSTVPVVVVSARTELRSRVRSFTLGAVDFLPKPFWMEELVMRIRARLAPMAAEPDTVLRWADVALDRDARVVRRAGEEVGLTPVEYNALAWLVHRRGFAVSRQQLAQKAMANRGDRIDRTIDSHLSRVRKKLGPVAAGAIRSVWGVGWRFDL